MKLLTAIQQALPENSRKNLSDNVHLKVLYSNMLPETREEVVYRKNGRSVDRVIVFDIQTGAKVKTTHYDYFNDKKIRSVDEYDRKTGKKIRTVNYVLYKSVDEYDAETKISSIQEYDLDTGKIVTISIYKRDGKTVSIIKRIDPVTEKVTSWINNKNTGYKPVEPVKIMTRCYDNIKIADNKDKEDIAKLIDNLYCNNLKFENIEA